MSLPAAAQSTKNKLLAVEAGLNDSSSIIRLSTLEEALADKSKAVREYAMSQAFVSSDATMRSLAINHFFRSRKSFAVSVEKSPEFAAANGDDDYRYSHRLLRTYGPATNYMISNYDEATGAIQGYCVTGGANSLEAKYSFVGSITGDSIAFRHHCRVHYSVAQCSVELKLASAAAKLAGSMQCGSAEYPATATIKLN